MQLMKVTDLYHDFMGIKNNNSNYSINKINYTETLPYFIKI
jgi:hypothetical protein